ncbi:hypothetical protein QYE76_047392 [Lolium multiflorum]|uniref:Uncharacterized protein n=1 Tax=Lolium multiflorum TaxID=4521 RepID=A0AAD8TNQ5_LOLMU|nr:hypothetical protein QYE76_047392 [Lolium multiflorum]
MIGKIEDDGYGSQPSLVSTWVGAATPARNTGQHCCRDATPRKRSSRRPEAAPSAIRHRAGPSAVRRCRSLEYITALHTKLRVTGGNKTKTPGPGAQSSLRALARSCMKIGHIGFFFHDAGSKAALFWLIVGSTRTLSLVSRRDVTIKVLYCGICHSDLHTIKADWRNDIYTYTVVPG